MNALELLQARVTGHGSRTVVFANGFSTTQGCWDAMMSGVPDGTRVVRFDYVGSTPATQARWIADRYASYRGHADDLVRLLTALDVSGATVVAHSMSGMVAALASVQSPARIGHIVMIGASPCYVEEAEYHGGLTRAQTAALLLRANADLAAWMGGFAPLMLGRDASDGVLATYLSTFASIRPDIARTMLRSIFESDYRPLLRQVSAPVTVIQMTHDAAVPPFVGTYLARHLRCRQYVELDLEGHVPHLTHPERLRPLLTTALTADLTSAVTSLPTARV